MDKIEELLTRGVANIIPQKKGLEELLNTGEKLNVYLGIDPTATKIHLGHAVVLRKLQAFAEFGHNVTFLIGDFTALIGDTSDKDSERPVLTAEQINENFKTYQKQAEKILDFSKVKIRYNSEWLKKLSYAEIIKMMQRFSLNDFIGRELIKKRLNEGKRVALHEVQYPIMQGYDSYYLDTDIQIGGTDQTFNMQAGRTLQKDLRGKGSFIVATEFLMGTDGRKMSKTWDNAIWLNDKPSDMYAKIMRIEDDLIVSYFTLATDVSLDEIEKVKSKIKNGNPINIKKRLAEKIVEEIHGPKPSEEAEEYFERTVQKKEAPQDIPIYQYIGHQSINIIDFLIKARLVESKSEAKRVVEQGGVAIDNQIISDPNASIAPKNEQIIRVGKRRFIKIQTAPK